MVAKRSDIDVTEIRSARAAGLTFADLADKFGCSVGTAHKLAGDVTSRGVVLEGGHVVAGHGRSVVEASSRITDQRK